MLVGFSAHLKIFFVFEQLAQAFARRRVIVDEKDFGGGDPMA